MRIHSYNTKYLTHHLNNAIENKYPLSALMVTIESPHMIEEFCMSEIISNVIKAVSKEETFFQLNSKQFVVILPKYSQSEAVILGYHIKKTIEPYLQSLKPSVIFNIGVSNYYTPQVAQTHLQTKS